MRDPSQQHDRAIAKAGLELRQIALGDVGVLGQSLARHATLVAQGAHAFAEPAQIRIDVAAAGGLSHGFGYRPGSIGDSPGTAVSHGSRVTCIIMPCNRPRAHRGKNPVVERPREC